MKLVKMEPEDDPQAFLLEFECAAEGSLWPKEQWAMRLAPLLSVEAQAVYQALPSYISKDYDRVKDAILDHLGVSEESYRKKFRSVTFTAGARPREVAHDLHEWCCRWLKPEMRNPAEIMELIILEQFIQILPAGAREWLRHCQVWSLDSLIQMIEDYLDVEDIKSAPSDGYSKVIGLACEEDQVTEGIVTVKPEMTSVFGKFEDPSLEDLQKAKGRERMEEGEVSSVGDLKVSVVEVKIEEGEAPSAIDLQDSMDRVKIEKENDPSGWELQDSLVQVKIEVEQELSVIDLHHLMDGVNIEEWEQPSARYLDDSGLRESVGSSSAGKVIINKYKNHVNMTGKLEPQNTKSGENKKKAQQFIKQETTTRSHTRSQSRQVDSSGNRLSTETTRCDSKSTISIRSPSPPVIHQGDELPGCGECVTITTRWACSECEKTFSSSSYLTRHRKNHMKEVMNTCNECGKGFMTSRSLTAHQLTHGGQNPYLCYECGESFCDPPSFIAHQKMHPVKKPYSCPDCGKSFTTKSGMNLHWRRKHSW